MFVKPLIDPSTMNEDTIWTKIGDLQKRMVMASQNGNQQMVMQFQSLLDMFSLELENRQAMKVFQDDKESMKSGVVYESDPDLAEQQGLNKKEDKKQEWKK